MELLCEPLSPPPPPSSAGDMRSDSERALRMTHRKFNKHMAEKRRRARINNALEEMKNMVLSGMQKDPEHYDKMEKADILDLTVKYVTTVVAESPELSAALSGKRFRVGYDEALKEVDAFLNTVAMETSAKSRLVGHLSTQAPTQSASHVLSRLEGERQMAAAYHHHEEARRRETSILPPNAASRQPAPTAVVAPVHVAAPHSHASAGSAAAAAAAAAASAAESYRMDMDARLKQAHHEHQQAAISAVNKGQSLPPPHPHQQFMAAAEVGCLPLPAHLPPHHPLHQMAHAQSHPNMARPVPIDLRHKYFPVADRCVPVPLYDSMWRPWDRPVSV